MMNRRWKNPQWDGSLKYATVTLNLIWLLSRNVRSVGVFNITRITLLVKQSVNKHKSVTISEADDLYMWKESWTCIIDSLANQD